MEEKAPGFWEGFAVGRANGGNSEAVYHIVYDDGNNTILRNGEVVDWLELAQRIMDGAEIRLTGEVDGHKFQATDYFVADNGNGVVIFPMTIYPMSGAKAQQVQVIIVMVEQLAIHSMVKFTVDSEQT